MSGTGKSSVIQALADRGLKAIDTDWNPEWERVEGEEWVWREDQIRSLTRRWNDCPGLAPWFALPDWSAGTGVHLRVAVLPRHPDG